MGHTKLDRLRPFGLQKRVGISLLLCMTVLVLWRPQAVAAQADHEAILATVTYADQAQLNRLAADLDIWEVDAERRTFRALLTDGQQQMLAAAGHRIQVEERIPLAPEATQRRTEPQAGIDGFACYRTVEETYADLAQLAADHPNLATWLDIGDSWRKTTGSDGDGYDLHVLRLTNSAVAGPKPVLMLMAALHAREYTTAEVVTRFAERLIAGYGVDAEITWLLDFTEIHILPQANPDGRKMAEEGRLWRKNVNDSVACAASATLNGVDLNRNSAFRWNQCTNLFCSSAEACAITYRGEAPASEPETQSIQGYMRTIFEDRRGPDDQAPAPLNSSGLFLTLHSYSELILFPWAWSTAPSPNRDQLRTLGRKFGYYTGYAVCQTGEEGCLYTADGTTDDWAYGALGVAAYTFELGTAFFEQCSTFEEEILEQNLTALTYAAKAARRPYQTPAGPEALDLGLSLPSVERGREVTFTVALDDRRYESKGFGQEPVQNIAAARYSVDLPSWLAETQNAGQAQDGHFDEPREVARGLVETGCLATTRHTLFVEGADADGNWGVPSAAFFNVTNGDHALCLRGATSRNMSEPAAVQPYHFVITNTGVLTDTFALTVTADLWPVSAPVSVGPLAPGASAQFSVTVMPPEVVMSSTIDRATLRIGSRADNSIRTARTLSTSVVRTPLYLPAFFGSRRTIVEPQSPR